MEPVVCYMCKSTGWQVGKDGNKIKCPLCSGTGARVKAIE